MIPAIALNVATPTVLDIGLKRKQPGERYTTHRLAFGLPTTLPCLLLSTRLDIIALNSFDLRFFDHSALVDTKGVPCKVFAPFSGH